MGYTLLCKVAVTHAYEGQGAGLLNCVPTAQSAQWMQRRDVLVRAMPDSISLWCEAERRDLIVEEGTPGELLLGLRWYARDPWFSLYSFPPPPSEDSVLFLRSAAPSANSAQTGVQDLSMGVQAFATLDDAGLAQHLDRQDQLRKPVMVTEIDLAHLAPLSHSTHPAPSADGGQEQGVQFRVAFGARASRWKYYFFSTMQADPSHLAVVDLEGVIDFSYVGTELFPGGRQAVVFLSQREIVMQAQYPQRLQLRERSKTGERVLMARLPNADIRSVMRNTIDGETALVSEIYIN